MLLNHDIYPSCAGARDDIAAINPQFTFTNESSFSNGSFIVLDDDIYEYDKLLMAEFDFDQTVRRLGFNTVKGQPNVTYIMIKDDDSKWRIAFTHNISRICKFGILVSMFALFSNVFYKCNGSCE